MFTKRANADEAKEFFLKAVRPVDGTEILPLVNCGGRIAGEDIIAPADVPHYRRAAMDGFAVLSSDTLGAGSSSPVVLRLGPGVEKGMCMRVHTGSPVPDNADAVVMLEDTVVHDEIVEIFSQIHPFKNVGEIGEDIPVITQDGFVLVQEIFDILQSSSRFQKHGLAAKGNRNPAPLPFRKFSGIDL